MNKPDWKYAPKDAMYARIGTSGVTWYKKESDQWYRWLTRKDGRTPDWYTALSWDRELLEGQLFIRSNDTKSRIDWDNAPEDATHYDFGIPGDPEEPPSFMRFDHRGCYWWDEDINRWEVYGEAGKFTADVVMRRSIPRPESKQANEVTVKEIRQLAINSGLQVEFHACGGIWVFDEGNETSVKVGSIEEYIELAEVKNEYLKVWCKHRWD